MCIIYTHARLTIERILIYWLELKFRTRRPSLPWPRGYVPDPRLCYREVSRGLPRRYQRVGCTRRDAVLRRPGPVRSVEPATTRSQTRPTPSVGAPGPPLFLTPVISRARACTCVLVFVCVCVFFFFVNFFPSHRARVCYF